MVLRLLENKFVGQKIKSIHFCSSHKQNSSPGFYLHHSRQEGNHPFLTNKAFWKYIFPSRAAEDYEAEKLPKLNLLGNWLQVLIYYTICNLYIFRFYFVVP